MDQPQPTAAVPAKAAAKGRFMTILLSIPLIGVLLLIYNLLLFSSDVAGKLNAVLFSMTLMSGAKWSLTFGDVLLVLGVLMLYIELVKATRTGTASILDHVFSLIIFIIFVIEFIAVKGCGTSVFLVLGLISLLDVVAGFTITIVAARRDLAVEAPLGKF